MLLSETDAKAKTCPLSVLVPDQRDALTGDGIRQGGPWGCAGSGCMAWRWYDNEWGPTAKWISWDGADRDARVDEPPSEERARLSVPDTFEWHAASVSDDTFAGWFEPKAEAVARRRGFCGLGGNPQ
jgi:hypothetical protein